MRYLVTRHWELLVVVVTGGTGGQTINDARVVPPLLVSPRVNITTLLALIMTTTLSVG